MMSAFKYIPLTILKLHFKAGLFKIINISFCIVSIQLLPTLASTFRRGLIYHYKFLALIAGLSKSPKSYSISLGIITVTSEL